jgi:predicted DNA-binding ribbon-helix-helix protein
LIVAREVFDPEQAEMKSFWQGLKDIAQSRRTTLSVLVSSIDTDREQGNLSSAIRLFVLNHYKAGAASHLSDSRPRAIIAHASL